MITINYEYTWLPILIFIIFSMVLSLIILTASYSLSSIHLGVDIEKLSPYECGFNPFRDSRHEFDVKFYLVAILFIIFDIEISFLFPWSIIITMENGLMEYWVMLIFLGVLTIGFFYEWKKGALNW